MALLRSAASERRGGSRHGQAGHGAQGWAGRRGGAGRCAYIVDEARVGEEVEEDEDEDEDEEAPATASALASAAMLAAGRTERTLTTTVEFL